jgi:hypothetical protein
VVSDSHQQPMPTAIRHYSYRFFTPVPACLGKKKSMLATKTPSKGKKKMRKKKNHENALEDAIVERAPNSPANKYLYTVKRSFFGINLNTASSNPTKTQKKSESAKKKKQKKKKKKKKSECTNITKN